MNGMELIEAERRRQVTVEGWTPEHDKQHSIHTLAKAAGCYWRAVDRLAPMEKGWPWAANWWKPKNRLRNLVRSGALYLAAHDLAVQRKATASAALFFAQAVRVAEVIDEVFEVIEPETTQPK